MSEDPLVPPPLPAQRGNWWSGALVVGILLGALWLGIHEADVTPKVARSKNHVSYQFEKFAGGSFSSEEFKGRVVMIDFWASWCPPCVAEMPWLTKVAKEYEAKGVVFIAPSHDDPPDHKVAVGLFVDKVPLLKDAAAFTNDESMQTFGVEALPTLFVIGRDGAVQAARRGLLEESDVRGWLDAALKN